MVVQEELRPARVHLHIDRSESGSLTVTTDGCIDPLLCLVDVCWSLAGKSDIQTLKRLGRPSRSCRCDASHLIDPYFRGSVLKFSPPIRIRSAKSVICVRLSPPTGRSTTCSSHWKRWIEMTAVLLSSLRRADHRLVSERQDHQCASFCRHRFRTVVSALSTFQSHILAEFRGSPVVLVVAIQPRVFSSSARIEKLANVEWKVVPHNPSEQHHFRTSALTCVRVDANDAVYGIHRPASSPQADRRALR